ncbi:glycosyltransferase family 2 protein [Alkaliphilus sp. B6464]|uniref:glycosyltransferase family 2 protein n=1 Tax=Alkaliphilus sp. B6464 TaxID=2731219 RepID=UPI001BA534F6|nr:glycosyltransferase family 2 protein [Alkaliphilus sp. B6464]QUH20799.1 glycosyltransferase family 2 protein [Alkaliphilus sp. B6464]
MKVTAIIPAYNEEKRIEKVIDPALKTDMLSNIIVVDDGSEDLTSNIVSKYNVDLIKMPQNSGKTAAVKEGIKCCKDRSDIIVLLDADLIGLTPNHIKSLILPLLEEQFDMTIGIFRSGRYVTDLAQYIAPHLSGQRAIKTHLADEILNLDITGYGIEVALSKLTRKHKLRVENVILENVTHTTKEEKIGFAKGAIWRIKMYKDIIKYWIH